MPTRKKRTLSKCREWERERRNRFNDACSQLAVLVVTNNVGENSSHTAATPVTSTPNLAKVEVVQKAITLIKHLIQMKSQLDAKLLALEDEMSEYKSVRPNKIDASTQVNKTKMVSKSTRNKKALWKEILRKDKLNINQEKNYLGSTALHHTKLPKLVPKLMATDKKVLDKAVVVLPVAPYIIPHRPIMLPPPPPTLYVLESFVSNSRNAMPVMPRVVSEITKTTMVNNIPIAAFSFPLSVSKNKKNKTSDKLADKEKHNFVHQRQLLIVNKKSKKLSNKNGNDKENVMNNSIQATNTIQIENETQRNIEKQGNTKELSSVRNGTLESHNIENKDIENKDNKLYVSLANDEVTIIPENSKASHLSSESKKDFNKSAPQKPEEVHKHCETICESNKTSNEIHTPESEDKKKQDKMQSILDTSMCDSNVDGGNARLELAEELLAAASPTAAFLMSFPLVSGGRADSPADEEHHTVTHTSTRALSTHKRENIPVDTQQIDKFFSKSSDIEKTMQNGNTNAMTSLSQCSDKFKIPEKQSILKQNIGSLGLTAAQSVSEPSFLNLVPSMMNTATTTSDMFSLDFEAIYSKNTTSNQSCVNSNNFLLKNDSLNTKTTNISMYSSNSLAIGHDYNNFGLYPCAMEKYSNNNKNKGELLPTDENFIKIGSGRLNYDFDLGLSQKPYEFTTNSSNISSLSKENIFPAVTFQNSTYNPFNPDFHVPLPASTENSLSGKKSNVKPNPFYTETFTNLYSQPSTLWPDDLNIYGNTSNVSKVSGVRSHDHNLFNNQHPSTNHNKYNNTNIFESKAQTNAVITTISSKLEVNQLVSEKNNKKSPSKSHINWMTSDARPAHINTFDFQNIESKDSTRIQFTGTMSHSALLPHFDYVSKKQDYMDTNLFPISVPSHTNQDDVHLWPSARPLVAAEIVLDPPPINLPTLVGDLALGPHDRRKSTDRTNRGGIVQSDISSCNNFLSVTQLMNRPTEMSGLRGQYPIVDTQKSSSTKNDNIFQYAGIAPEKANVSLVDTNSMQPCYFFNDSKDLNVHYNSNNIPHYVTNQTKHKNKVSERSKCHKNNYSTEALLKGANNSLKNDNYSSVKFANSSQKLPGYGSGQEGQMAQVSHFPCIADYPDNTYSSSGLYNSSTSTVSNSFYSNLISTGGNIMSTSYTSANFTPEFVDFAPAPPSTDCNYTYPIFENFKMKSQPDTSGLPKLSLEPKVTHKELLGKHKAEYSKKEQKKYSTKKSKICTEISEWGETSDATHSRHAKKNAYIMSEDVPFSNYLMNQCPTHTQHTALPELLCYPPSAISAAATITPATPRTQLNCPSNVTRTNFNLSTLFPEIAKIRHT